MTVEESINKPAASEAFAREAGLARELSTRQMAMIAIGGAIGTGLFLGSSLAVRIAGPGVILSYVLGAVVALLMMGALSEMAVAHPTAGSFGVYAELYVSRWAGFVVRYTYWAAQSIAIGGEATAIAVYCQWWFPRLPGWVWVAGFSIMLVTVNARSVGSFGEFEYWFAMIKVAAIVAFIVFGLAALGLSVFGHSPAQGIGLHNYTAFGGFLPHGLKGAWMAMVFVIFSYIGTELVAVTAGEAKNPEQAVPKAMRSMVLRLILFYIGAMVVLIGVAPWNRIQPGADVTASPFVKVFELMRIPGATHIMNFVVLTAALSSMNSDLYVVTRMMFSLSRGGYAPERFGRLSPRGTPIPALLISTFGLVVATIIAVLYPRSAYVYMFGIVMFGGLFVWIMIFVTHLFFRQAWLAKGRARLPVQMAGYPYTTMLGFLLLLAVLVSTWWVEGMRVTIVAGVPWLAFISLAYGIWTKRRKPSQGDDRASGPSVG